MNIRATLFLLLTALALPLAASTFSDFYVIPAAGHVGGLLGESWRSDVTIHNFQSTPITVEMELVETGVRVFDNVHPILVDGASKITIAPGATRTVEDVLNQHRGGAEALGAILIGADKPF